MGVALLVGKPIVPRFSTCYPKVVDAPYSFVLYGAVKAEFSISAVAREKAIRLAILGV
jgi:hypothetical protein